MNKHNIINNRIISVIGFSLFSVYSLSFLFEGQVLYSVLACYEMQGPVYIMAAIVAHFVGLFSCGFFVKSPKAAKQSLLGSMGVCLIATTPFFFAPSVFWMAGLIAGGYAAGFVVAAWGYFLKTFTPKKQRIKTCADALIFSNLAMIAANIVAVKFTPFMGLIFTVLCLAAGMVFFGTLPIDTKKTWEEETENKLHGDIKKPLLLLCLFVFVITINSGLMYQVINPAFEHLKGLVTWYWAVPYIIALIIVRNLPAEVNRSIILYVGMAMIVGAFISFMLLKRNATDYLVVDTLMLGACGIFDLFWWSILGEMLDYTKNPVKIFSTGLSSNVFGVLSGGSLGMLITSSIQFPGTEVAVIALTVVCITLVMLPLLNRQLIMLLKDHAYLADYDRIDEARQAYLVRQDNIQRDTIQQQIPPAELTAREQEVLQHIVAGKTNREIAAALYVSESTVKTTHARNIYLKYGVGTRTELIIVLLKNQSY